MTEMIKIYLKIHKKVVKAFLIFLKYELDIRHYWISSAGGDWRLLFSSSEDLQLIRGQKKPQGQLEFFSFRNFQTYFSTSSDFNGQPY